MITEGQRVLQGALQAGRPGPYQLQAVIAACHAGADKAADTDWPVIAQVYGQLGRINPSPVVELNRAVAVGMAQGPDAGLALLDALAAEGQALRAAGGYGSTSQAETTGCSCSMPGHIGTSRIAIRRRG
jgi:RNA polymerase sigma-70 factor (ECF subfamily)